MTDQVRCTATRADGTPCGARGNITDTPEGSRCLFHDPARADQVAEGRRRGGQKHALARTVDPGELPGGPPETLEDALRWCAWAAFAVATGKIDARTAREVGYNVSQVRGIVEKLDLQRRVRELEALVKKLRKTKA